MSVVRCVHCNATGRCGCYECAKHSKGESYAKEREISCFTYAMLAPPAQNPPPKCVEVHPLALLFVLPLLPRLVAGAVQSKETYFCLICRGTGYNSFPGRR